MTARTNPLRRFAEAPLAVSTTLGCVASGYLALLTFAAITRRRPGLSRGDATTTFAIFVPAHDEAGGIAAALNSFSRLDYPRDRFSVHVVADNCTDGTADVVRAHGWTVHERNAPEHPGKGPALNWLLDRLSTATATSTSTSTSIDFDVVVVVDADTVVEDGFLSALDAAFTSDPGADGSQVTVAQGFYGVRDPDASAATGLRYAALACRHHVRPLGRNRLGASAGLYGNGMAFRREVLQAHPWTGHLVEDAELQLRLLLDDGITVTYVPRARLAAEMPTTKDAATSQNARWERGRIDLVTRFAGRLARRAWSGGPARRWSYVDALADLLLPPLSVLVAVQGVTAVANTAAGVLGSRRATRRASVDTAALLFLGAHVLVGLRSVSAPPAVYRSLLSAPSTVVWKVALWLKVLRPSSDVSWTRTKRNSER